MARVRTCMACRKPERECECPPEDDEPQAPDGDQGSGEDGTA